MEQCVKDHIVNHMTRNKLFSTQQFGFINGRSTVLQLLNVMDSWTKALDRGESIDVLYLDFMKAFDTVPHKRLIGKLKSYGIEYYTLRWIQAFLSDRVQQVNVNGTNSEWANITSGIPQDSVLGLILFVLYINDLPDNIVSNVYMFADDTKVFKTINSPNDQHTLHNDLDYLTSWSSKWLLRFHPDKCNLMHVGKTIQQEYAYNLKIDNTAYILGEIEEQKDIGVIVDSNLEFDKHINQKINKAKSIMAVIRRSFTTLNQHNVVPLYIGLVIGHLDYAISIWPPYKQKYKDAIESVQRRATKQLPGMKDIPYEERLERLKLPTLAYRRTRGNMTEVYKLLQGKYDSNVSNIVKLHKDSDTREGTRSRSLKLFIKRARTNV